MVDDPNADLLLKDAEDLRSILRTQARRAFVLELTGTPKAGKSTAVGVLHSFFKHAGYQVHVLRERAEKCPLPMKGHFFFNAWTTATMLAEVLETHETDVDLLILDRGFLDALVWLELQARRGQVLPEEKEKFADFVLLERWRTLVDATVVMKATPEKALEREHGNQIIPRSGSMMNLASLRDFNDALDAVVGRYDDIFRSIRIDTTDTATSIQTCVDVVRDVLPRLRNWADPKIAVVPRTSVEGHFGSKPFIHADQAAAALAALAEQVEYRPRSEVEEDDGLVQLVASGILAHKDKVVVFLREQLDAKTQDYGRRTLWVGCHVDHEAVGGQSRGGDGESASLLGRAEECLRKRVQNDLHLAAVPKPDFLGLAWNQEQKETRHLGIMFRVSIDSEYVAKHLENKVFKKMARSRRLKSVFMTQPEILGDLIQLDLEAWSKHMAMNLNLIRSNLKDGT